MAASQCIKQHLLAEAYRLKAIPANAHLRPKWVNMMSFTVDFS